MSEFSILFAAMNVLSALLAMIIYVYLTALILEEMGYKLRDGYKKLRRIILISLIISSVTLAPILYYSGLRAAGLESLFFRDLATLTSGANKLAPAIGLLFMFKYRKQKEE